MCVCVCAIFCSARSIFSLDIIASYYKYNYNLQAVNLTTNWLSKGKDLTFNQQNFDNMSSISGYYVREAFNIDNFVVHHRK